MDGLGSSASGGISATAIGLIVGLGIVPVIILIWVVSWLFWCYPYNRSCCCTRRKKKQVDEEIYGHGHQTGRSVDSFHAKAAYPMPGPERASINYGSEFGNWTGSNADGYGNNRLAKTDARLSLNTVNSTNTMHYTQEPKPFV
ncbi:hypothetical protein BDU57DRAFT_541464 [Ampelomyces quisqualis]|uniref:Uncharacterized protein n=1 Tax=Ampelomyces quisqualis TaxID=50730 RepID=A0A6A5QBJ4_AMPQU|nr:hypothetical protein BDU57DRAFT_541464 [Ampelomyces quisqualis]